LLFDIRRLGDTHIFSDDAIEDGRVDARNGVAPHAHYGLLVQFAGWAEARDDDAQAEDLVLGAQGEIRHAVEHERYAERREYIGHHRNQEIAANGDAVERDDAE